MKKILRQIILSVMLLGFSFSAASAAVVKAPSIVAAFEQRQNGVRVLEVRGLAPADTDVLVYINLQVAGIAKTKNENGDLSSFFYTQNSNLPTGSYQVSAVARDKTTYVVSEFSKSLEVKESKVLVEEKVAPKVFPPTLLRSVVDSESKYNRPKIIGQALSGQRIEVFIDDKKDGQILLDKTRPGTNQFIYVPTADMSPGQHKVYLYAFDEANNQSEKSNLIYINVTGETEGKIDSGASESKDAAKDAPKEENGNDGKSATDLEEILGYEPSTTTAEETGLIDEAKDNQSKVKLNLLVFLLFLIAIILWIFWVNRELIKEKEGIESDGTGPGPVDGRDSEIKTIKKNDAEYGLDDKKDDPDVLKF